MCNQEDNQDVSNDQSFDIEDKSDQLSDIPEPISSSETDTTLVVPRNKKKKSVLALWIPIIITGLIVLAFHLPEYFLKREIDETINELGNLDSLIRDVYDKRGKIPDGISSLLTQLYTSPDFGFEITFPDGWMIKSSGNPETIIKAVRKTAGGRLAMIAIAAYELGVEGDIWEVTGKEMYEGLREQYPGADIVLIDWGKTLVSGKHALWTRTDILKPIIMSASSTHYHFLFNGILFRISTSTDYDHVWYSNNDPLMRASVESFNFLQ